MNLIEIIYRKDVTVRAVCTVTKGHTLYDFFMLAFTA